MSEPTLTSTPLSLPTPFAAVNGVTITRQSWSDGDLYEVKMKPGTPDADLRKAESRIRAPWVLQSVHSPADVGDPDGFLYIGLWAARGE